MWKNLNYQESFEEIDRRTNTFHEGLKYYIKKNDCKKIA